MSTPLPPTTGTSMFATWTDQQKTEWIQQHFRPRFDEWVVRPAQKMAFASPEGFGMPAFVWLACMVDWLAGFWWGDSTRKVVRQAYTGFVAAFFPIGKYNSDQLYERLRNGLVHMYTIKDQTYALTDGRPEWHLRSSTSGQLILNLEDFYADCVAAKDAYFDATMTDPDLREKLLQRYERDGFLGLITVEV